MNYDDTNPFADSSIRQVTASNYSNQQTSSEYNPFTNTTTPARPAQPPQQQNLAAVLPPTQPAAYQPPVQPSSYQPPSYASVTTPIAVQQPTEKYGNDTKQTSTRVDLSQIERQQSELEEREKRLAERERALSNSTASTKHENNFPPLPKICPCGPCFYQNIAVEIPSQFQFPVRFIYYLWLVYSVTLFLNMIAALSYFVVDKGGAATFGLSIVYLVLFIPGSYLGWFRPIYRAFRIDSSASFMFFFFIGIMFIATNILFAIGIIGGMCGFARIYVMTTNTVVGVMMIILGCLWSFISAAAIFITIRVHRLYRQSGASLEQAQKELQTAFVNNPTVRGAAREVATAGINEVIRGNGNPK